jgi:hypothetical protein
LRGSFALWQSVALEDQFLRTADEILKSTVAARGDLPFERKLEVPELLCALKIDAAGANGRAPQKSRLDAPVAVRKLIRTRTSPTTRRLAVEKQNPTCAQLFRSEFILSIDRLAGSSEAEPVTIEATIAAVRGDIGAEDGV